MIGLALKWALGGLGWLRSVAGALGRWLLADWRNPVLFAAGFNLLVHWLIIDPRARDARDMALAQRNAARAALDDRERAYRAASQAAAQAQADNLRRVEAEQAAISERTVHEYQDRIAALRARAGELRRADRLLGAAPRAAAGGSGPAGLPAHAIAPGGAADAAEDARFPEPLFGIEERLVASEQAEQLAALIDWVEAQARVRVDPVAGPVTEEVSP